MKAPSFLLTTMAIICTGMVSAVDSAAQSAPTGSLSVDRTLVRENSSPNITWDITYPSVIEDLVTIEPPGKITPKEDLDMEVRVIGASFQSSPGNWKPIQALVRADGSSGYSQIFYNTQPNVNPAQVYYSKRVRKNRPNYFGGRYNWSGWGRSYLTSNSTQNIATLKNGDVPPSYAPAFSQGGVEAFLQPYMEDGKINIGPLDVIIVFELYSTSPGSTYFDMQDLVLLVTFSKP